MVFAVFQYRQMLPGRSCFTRWIAKNTSTTSVLTRSWLKFGVMLLMAAMARGTGWKWTNSIKLLACPTTL